MSRMAPILAPEFFSFLWITWNFMEKGTLRGST